MKRQISMCCFCVFGIAVRELKPLKRTVFTVVSLSFCSLNVTVKLTVTPSVVLTIFLPLPLCSLSSCHVCDFQTELNAQFVSHMSLHVDKEQWMFSLCCSVCDYACMEEADMKNHISTGHAGTASQLSCSKCC